MCRPRRVRWARRLALVRLEVGRAHPAGDRLAVGTRRGGQAARGHGRDAQRVGRRDQACGACHRATAAARGPRGRVLGAHAVRVQLDLPPERDGAADELGRARRRGARGRVVPGVDPAGAAVLRRGWSWAAQRAVCTLPVPPVVLAQRQQRGAAQPPLPVADDRADEVGGLSGRGQRAPWGAGAGSAGGSTRRGGCGATGTSTGSTRIVRDGPSSDMTRPVLRAARVGATGAPGSRRPGWQPGVPLRALVAVGGDAAGVLEHARHVHEVPGHEATCCGW